MKIVIKKSNSDNTNNAITAGVIFDSMPNDKKLTEVFRKVDEIEREYIQFINEAKIIVDELIKSPYDIDLRWRLADKIYKFKEKLENDNIEIIEFDKTLARDLLYKLEPTVKGDSLSKEVKALLALKTIYPTKPIDERFSWNLFYLTYDIFLNLRNRNNNYSYVTSNNNFIKELLDLANRQAKIGKGNNNARSVAKRIIRILADNGLLCLT
jgi:hypothetical protein